jgi:hypothetical protein
MLEYRMINTDARKREIIDLMASAPYGDDVVSPQDRVIIADLVLAGVEKMMVAINAHLEMSAKVLSSNDAAMALALLQIMELRGITESIVHQLGLQALDDVISALMKVKGRSA